MEDNWIPWDEALASTEDRYVLLRIDMRDCHAYAGDKMKHYNEGDPRGSIPLDDIKSVISLAMKEQWTWLNNSRCKYISILVDKETQLCDLYDRDDGKIFLENLQYQLDYKEQL